MFPPSSISASVIHLSLVHFGKVNSPKGGKLLTINWCFLFISFHNLNFLTDILLSSILKYIFFPIAFLEITIYIMPECK